MTTPRSSGARAVPSLAPGQTIAGRYVVTAHIGSGGMGDVYEVEHTLLGKRFALKRLSEDVGEDRAMVERFLREARAAAATGHPGIVDVIDLGFADDGKPFLVMERLAGETLRRRLDRGPLDPRTLIRLGRAVLDALAAVHRASIIHRDIKPENLFLCRDGRLKILDFGLSHHTTVDVRLTQSGAVMGTPLYMSPEQARGEDVDARTDLYATGAVLYECATGRPPFMAPAYSVLVAMILEIKPNPERLSALPAGVREVILSALAKKVEDRPATAEAMSEVLGGDDGDGDDDDGWGEIPDEERPGGEVASAPTVASGEAARVAASSGMDETIAASVGSPPTEPAVEQPSEVRRAGRRWVWLAAAVAAAAFVAAFGIVMATRGGDSPEPGPGAGTALVAWQTLALAGDLEGAGEETRRMLLRTPDDRDLIGRDLLLALLEDRTRAYARVRELEGQTLPVFAASAVAAVRAVEGGQPDVGADALGAAAATVEPGSVDDLLIRQARASLLKMADRFDRARGDLISILERWPGFEPALDDLLQPLLLREELDEARRRVDAYLAAAPPGEAVVLVEAELLIGERRYRDALDRVDKLIAESPGRATEAFQFQGDLRLLLGDPAGAIAAYDVIDDDARRDEYVAGALGHQGRFAEARGLLLEAMARFPADAKPSRLGKLMLDASLIALATGDRELADAAARALGARDPRRLEAAVQSAHGFARGVRARLAGDRFDPVELPLGAESPLAVLLAVHGVSGEEALALVREETGPEHLHLGVVPTHVYPALYLQRARLEHEAGDQAAALEWLDRVIRPRHYDASRGAVLLDALALRAAVLDATGRQGEAEAVRREVARLRGS